MEIKILANGEARPKASPPNPGAEGRVSASEQSVPWQRDLLAGHLQGTWFSLPPTAGIFHVYLITFHCVQILLF